jgi:hypothetical protein
MHTCDQQDSASLTDATTNPPYVVLLQQPLRSLQHLQLKSLHVYLHHLTSMRKKLTIE